jgi:RimJ/RimL family protein N-acetyltransferase
MKAIETARLRIRRIVPSDVTAMFAVYGDAESMRYVADGQPLTFERCEQWVRVTEKNYAVRGYGMFALEERATGEVVGFAGLVHPGGQEEAELKYALARPHFGRGYATEAAIALLEYGRTVVQTRRIIATADPGNVASHRVLGKAGMRPAGPRTNDDGTKTLVFTLEF